MTDGEFAGTDHMHAVPRTGNGRERALCLLNSTSPSAAGLAHSESGTCKSPKGARRKGGRGASAERRPDAPSGGGGGGGTEDDKENHRGAAPAPAAAAAAAATVVGILSGPAAAAAGKPSGPSPRRPCGDLEQPDGGVGVGAPPPPQPAPAPAPVGPCGAGAVVLQSRRVALLWNQKSAGWSTV
jgi:hypothetical protein